MLQQAGLGRTLAGGSNDQDGIRCPVLAVCPALLGVPGSTAPALAAAVQGRWDPGCIVRSPLLS